MKTYVFIIRPKDGSPPFITEPTSLFNVMRLEAIEHLRTSGYSRDEVNAIRSYLTDLVDSEKWFAKNRLDAAKDKKSDKKSDKKTKIAKTAKTKKEGK